VGDRVCGVGAYPGSRWLVPLVFTFPSDMAVWLTELGCLDLRWGSSKVVGVCRLGAGLQFPSPGLAQAWAFTRGIDDSGNSGGGREGGGKNVVIWQHLNCHFPIWIVTKLVLLIIIIYNY